MNERQKQVVGGAFRMLSASARRGNRMINDGATTAEIAEHVINIELHVVRMKEALGLAAGAAVVLAAAQTASKRYLLVRRIGTNEVVKRVEIGDDKSASMIEKVVSGLLRNMSDDYYVDDSHAVVPRKVG